MKTTILSSLAIVLLFSFNRVSSKEVTSKNTDLQQSTVSITCTSDLLDLTSKWAKEYHYLNPGVNINVINASKTKIDRGENINLNFITSNSLTTNINETNWKIVVGRDVVVPIINIENPFLKELIRKGVTLEMLKLIFKNPEKQYWGDIITCAQKVPVHIYMINNESVKAGVTKFLQSTQIPIDGIIMGSSDEVVSAIQKDKYALGFCNVVNILSSGNQSLIENIKLLPIDKNGNGTIDYMEDIYSDLHLFLRGVWIGKYPKSLYSNIYVISQKQPTNETELTFLTWVLSDGQKYLNSSGFCDLITNESQSQLDKINTVMICVQPKKNALTTSLILLIFTGIIILGAIFNAVVRYKRKIKIAVADAHIGHSQGFDEKVLIVPQGLYFDKTHTWAFMEKDGTVSVGIDDFLQHITGPITRIEMKNPGEIIKKGDLLFSIIQLGKQLNLYSPVSGTIKKHNESLVTKSSYINSSPYSEGWVYLIEPINWYKEIQLLDIADKYKRWLCTEFQRVKDFLATTLKPDNLEYSYIVLQDGGILKDGILSDFGPEIWEDFQTKFLDTYK